MINWDIEFWRKDTEDLLNQSKADLIRHGYTEGEAVELLTTLYYSIGAEFGE